MTGRRQQGRAVAAGLAAALGLAATLTGCTDAERPGSPAAADVSVTDSAEIELVQNTGGDVPLVLHEELRIGAVAGDEAYQLHLVRNVSVGMGDTLFVALLGANEIRVFGPDGRYVRTIGSAGEGPGEFQSLSTTFLTGDTVVALDARVYRMTAFRTDGRILATWPARFGSHMVVPFARGPAGWLASSEDFSRRPPIEAGRRRELVQRIVLVESPMELASRMGPEGALPEGIPTVLEYVWTRSEGMMAGSVPVGRAPLWNARRQRGTDAGGRIFLTSDEGYRVDVHDSRGRLLRRISRVHEPVPVTPALLDRFLSEVEAHYDTVDARTEFGSDPVELYREDVARHRGTPLPALGALVVAADGSFLVERPDQVDDPVALEWSRLGPQDEHWDVFDAEGRFTGTVRIPSAFRPLAGSSTWVVGVLRDELDVEYVVRYRIEAAQQTGTG